MRDDLINKLKASEGFKGDSYLDSLNIPTIGFGTKLPLSEEEAELLLRSRLNKKINELLNEKPIIFRLPQLKQEVLFEMAYQLGTGGLLKFKKMWSALELFDYETAADEMLDSRWFEQTPNRAKKLSDIIRG